MISGAILKRLAALDLSKEALCEVLSIIGDMQAPEESRRERDRERKRRSKEIPRTVRGKGAEIPADPSSAVPGPSPSPPTPPVTPTLTLPPSTTAKAKRATRLDPAWAPGLAELDDASRIGLTEPEIAVEAPHFRDHHLAKGSVMADWGAAWRTWCTKALGYRAQGPPRGRSSPQSRRPEPPGIFDALDKIIDLDSKR